MRALIRTLVAVASGAGLGLASRAAVEPGPARPTAALFAAYGAAAAIAPALARNGTARERLAGGAGAAGLAILGAYVAALVAGDAAALGAACVAGAGAAIAVAAASWAADFGAGEARAWCAGSLVAGALAAVVFLADPFVDWQRGRGSLARAELAVAASPLASIAADTGFDWQRSRWLYDGPDWGGGGLSRIGQDYPVRAASPWLWAAIALGAAGVGLGAPLPRRGRQRAA